MKNLSERAEQIMSACILFGVPGTRDTAYALQELAEAVHQELDSPVPDDFSDI
jgi:hypothetical protein